MPELAEVEWYRKQWGAARGAEVVDLSLHARNRVFRGTNVRELQRNLIDEKLLNSYARGKRMLVTFEESVITGGFGSGVLELVEEARLIDPAYRDIAVRILGIPGERFVDHGSVSDLRRVLRLDSMGLAAQVREALETLRQGIEAQYQVPLLASSLASALTALKALLTPTSEACSEASR